jgi:multiple sugar transport system substrate-binding protein
VAAWLLALVAGIASAAPPVVLRHMLWDASQRPMYQQCASDFERGHPGVRVRVQQQGWDDYWSTLSTGFISDTAPDVFANHLSKFTEQVENGVLVDLAPLAGRDRVAADAYLPGLYAHWGREGHQYALPADWDTVAMLVNLDMARRAGISDADLATMAWNPKDGGSFGRIIARLTLDQAGRNALDPAFDKAHVKVYGYQTPSSGGMMGQTEWSFLAVSNGFRYQDAPWSPQLHYDDPRLAETLDWLASLPQRGISATPQTLGRMGAETLFGMGRVAMVPTGAWMTGQLSRTIKFPHAWVPLPAGPSGQRASMLNGVGHSIWAGSPHREAAWQWVRYLGSPACQQVVAQAGVVYPAIRGLAEVTLQVQRQAGADASVFLAMARGPTFAPPIVANAAEITEVMDSAMQRILFKGLPAGPALQQANQRARALAQQR